MLRVRFLRENFLANSRLNLNINLVNEPEKAAFPSYAFKIGAWIWSENIPILKTNQTALKGDANQLADGTFHSFTLLTHALTTDLSELKERANFLDFVLLELNYPSLKRGNGISCNIGQDDGYAVPVCLLDFKKPYCGCEGSFENRGCPYGIIPGTTKCRSSSIIKCCKESLKNQLDLVLVVDTSGSIGSDNFIKIKFFLISLISNFEISTDETRISLIEFNDNANDLLTFSNFQNLNNVKEVTQNIPYKGSGGTNTAEALRLANFRILQEARGMRNESAGVSKVIILVTDGDSDNNAQTIMSAKAIKDRGFFIITVGIGNLFTNEKELIDTASSRNDAYKIDDYDKIITFLSTLSKSSNQKSAIIPRNVEIESQVNKYLYKYITVNISTITTKKLYIKVENEANSRAEIYCSFDDPNPIIKSNYVINKQVNCNKF
jgi:collagen type VI alpha